MCRPRICRPVLKPRRFTPAGFLLSGRYAFAGNPASALARVSARVSLFRSSSPPCTRGVAAVKTGLGISGCTHRKWLLPVRVPEYPSALANCSMSRWNLRLPTIDSDQDKIIPRHMASDDPVKLLWRYSHPAQAAVLESRHQPMLVDGSRHPAPGPPGHVGGFRAAVGAPGGDALAGPLHGPTAAILASLAGPAACGARRTKRTPPSRPWLAQSICRAAC